MVYKYAYFVGTLIFFLIWISLYLYKKPLRREMLIMSLIFAPLGPLSEIFHFRDYWQPEYIFTILGLGIEDLLFAFFIGGIAAVIYEELFTKKAKKTEKEHLKMLIALGVLGILALTILTFGLKMNSIYSSSLVFIFLGIIMISKRRDLAKNAILSGILVAAIMFAFHLIYTSIFPTIIQEWWKLENLSGIFLLGIPIEEMMWGFAWGFFAGPIYEFWKGIKVK